MSNQRDPLAEKMQEEGGQAIGCKPLTPDVCTQITFGLAEVHLGCHTLLPQRLAIATLTLK